jgi:hypothetical protein
MHKLWNIFIELWFFNSKAVELKLCFAELWDSTGNVQGFGRQIFFVMKLVNEIIMVHFHFSPNIYAQEALDSFSVQIYDNVCILH